MRIYARPSWMLVRQVIADLFVLVWGITWWAVGRSVDGIIRSIAGPSRRIAERADELRSSVDGAADQVGRVPGVGSSVRAPFDQMAGQIEAIADAARGQVQAIEQAASISGWVVFLIPVLTVLLFWLPWRLRFMRRSAATLALVEAEGGNDLLALRALASQPLRELRAISADPMTAWRSGDPEAVRQLADLELKKSGVNRRRPRSISPR